MPEPNMCPAEQEPVCEEPAAAASNEQTSSDLAQLPQGTGVACGPDAQNQGAVCGAQYNTSVRGVTVSGGASMSSGTYRDPSGQVTRGVDAQATTVKATIPGPIPGTSAELSGPNAHANATVNNSTASVGIGASAGGGAINYKDSEREASVGVSQGPAIGARVHYGQDSADGKRKYGVGADVGPFSVDYKTKDPVGDVAGLASRMLPTPLQQVAKLYNRLRGN